MDAARLTEITDVQQLRDLVAAQVAAIAKRDARLVERDAHLGERDHTSPSAIAPSSGRKPRSPS